MPAAIPPHKVLPADSPSKEHRLAMVEIMADAMNLPGRVEVSSLEMDREGEKLHLRYPGGHPQAISRCGVVAAHGYRYVFDPPSLARPRHYHPLGGDLCLWPHRAGRRGSICPPAGVPGQAFWSQGSHHHAARPGGHLVHPAAGSAQPGEGKRISSARRVRIYPDAPAL